MFSDLLNGISQGFFGETSTYIYSDLSETELKAIYEMSWVEINEVSTHTLTAEVMASDLLREPGKGDKLKRGTKTYQIQVSQTNFDGSIFTLILKE